MQLIEKNIAQVAKLDIKGIRVQLKHHMPMHAVHCADVSIVAYL